MKIFFYFVRVYDWFAARERASRCADARPYQKRLSVILLKSTWLTWASVKWGNAFFNKLATYCCTNSTLFPDGLSCPSAAKGTVILPALGVKFNEEIDSFYLHARVYKPLSVGPSFGRSVHWSVHPSVCLSICLSVRPSIGRWLLFFWVLWCGRRFSYDFKMFLLNFLTIWDQFEVNPGKNQQRRNGYFSPYRIFWHSEKSQVNFKLNLFDSIMTGVVWAKSFIKPLDQQRWLREARDLWRLALFLLKVFENVTLSPWK